MRTYGGTAAWVVWCCSFVEGKKGIQARVDIPSMKSTLRTPGGGHDSIVSRAQTKPDGSGHQESMWPNNNNRVIV